MSSIILCTFIYAVLHNVYCDNILIVSDMVSPSQKLWNFALAEGLVQQGHNVTMLAPDNLKHLGKHYNNYHDIYIEGLLDAITSGGEFSPEDMITSSVLSNMLMLNDYCVISCDFALQSEGLQKLLDYPDDFKFDAILFDLTDSPCLLPLMKRFHYPPSIAITAFLLPHYLSQQFGNDIHPAYLPSYLVDYPSEMSFSQRLLHYVWINLDRFLRKFNMKRRVEELMRKKFGEDMESIGQLEDHVSLLLCNLEPVFHNPQPLPPNIIPVGGLHIKAPGKLPKDIQDILDSAIDGAIIFALGTNMRSDALGSKKIKVLLEAFSKIKQTVLWKFESNLTEFHVPQNVVIRKWLPQTDILAHPNTKLFISHAGALSTLEASYYGVPILGMAFVADQHQNLRIMEQRNIARSLNFGALSVEHILENIHILLDGPSYSKAVAEVSEHMKDQPQSPLQRAVYWIEYAIRHNGTSFLNVKSRKMPLFVSTSMDVQLFLFCIVFIISICTLQGLLFVRTYFSTKKMAKAKIE